LATVYDLKGSSKKSIELPRPFNGEAKSELIRRAVIAENSFNLQPKGHHVLAGMQTTATYYGAMNSYRTGRHMGIAIRPREKLGGGRQGKVKRIPSAVKGKRAHPHVIGKILKENMNRQEYQRAMASSVASSKGKSIIVDDAMEEIKKTKAMLALFGSVKLLDTVQNTRKRVKKGLRRSSTVRHYKKTLLLVVGKDRGAVRAARNIAGVDACTVDHLTVGAFAPGGNPGRQVLWSESAVNGVESAISQMSLASQSKYFKELSK
jgi:large subunit ribosomal protein L4e